jgi:hypothetical protein
MNEIGKQGEGAFSQMGEEVLKALVGKVVDLGTAIRQNSEDIRKLSEQGTMLPEVDKRVGELGKHVEDLGKKVGEVAAGLMNINDRTAIPIGTIEELRAGLERHARLFERPLQKSVHYKHFLGKPFLVLAGMAVVVLSLAFFWNRAWERAELYTENDMKWRYMKLTHDSLVLNALGEADRVYLIEPAQFGKDVVAEEDRRALLYEKWLQMQEKYGEIKDLEGKEKKKSYSP